MDFFIGQNADERRRQEIEATIKTVGEIVGRLSNMQVFYQTEFLEKLLPAIILDQISAWGYGDFYEDINKLSSLRKSWPWSGLNGRKAKIILRV